MQVALIHLSLFYCNVSNRGLCHLALLSELEELNIDSRDVSDEGVYHLIKLKKLKSLDTFSGRITDVGCAHLSQIIIIIIILLRVRETMYYGLTSPKR